MHCNQYSLLQCNVVIRESFLFRYSSIPLFRVLQLPNLNQPVKSLDWKFFE